MFLIWSSNHYQQFLEQQAKELANTKKQVNIAHAILLSDFFSI